MTSKELRQIERENTARAYSAAHFTMLHIRDAIRAHKITMQEARELRNKALDGDVDGAERGLARLIRGET